MTEQAFFGEVRAKIEALREVYVATHRDEEFQAHLDRLLERDAEGVQLPRAVRHTSTGETRGIIVVDGAGGGKTSLIHRALTGHPALSAKSPDRMPWLGVRVPSPATLKSLGWEILRQSGYPQASGSRAQWSIWNLVRQRLQALGTVVLWIDEAHDLFKSGSPREADQMLKMLKSMMQGDSAVIVVLSGIESLWSIASFDDQVKRRYSKLELPSVSAAAEGEALEDILEGYCDIAGLEAPGDADLIDRLIHASRGRFGRCIENIISAIEVALLRRDTQLTIRHFVEAWEIAEGCAPERNVFVAARWAQIDLSA